MFMRKIRKVLRSQMFTGSVVGLFAFSATFNLLWLCTNQELLKVLASSLFAGMFATLWYLVLSEDPKSKYIKVHKDVYAK